MSLSHNKVFIGLLVAFAFFFGFFYCIPQFLPEIDKLFITIMIFLFATLAGFFISRQGMRYRQLVGKVTDFDGAISFFYRSIGVFGEDAQERAAIIIQKHYTAIMERSDWGHYFSVKSTTITDFNLLIAKEANEPEELTPAQTAFVMRAYHTLEELQRLRKNMVALYNENIPHFQWGLIIFLVVMLIVAIASIPSAQAFAESLFKASFATVIIAVLFMLMKLNRFTFFENMVGRSSGQDVLDIIEGKK